MSDWPAEEEIKGWQDKDLDKKWSDILKLRDFIMKILETKRASDMIGSSLEAMITLYSGNKETIEIIEKDIELFPFLFKVSQAVLVDAPEDKMEDYEPMQLKIGVKNAVGHKCPRCWNFSETVGTNKDYPDLCERCYNVMSERS